MLKGRGEGRELDCVEEELQGVLRAALETVPWCVHQLMGNWVAVWIHVKAINVNNFVASYTHPHFFFFLAYGFFEDY